MKALQNKYRILITFCLLVVTITTQAAEEKYVSNLQGSQLTVGATIDHAENEYGYMQANSSIWGNRFTNVLVKNTISLRLDREYLLPEAAFTYQVIFDVTYEDEDFDEFTFTDTLTVDYDPTAGTTHMDLDAITFTGAHYVNIEITGITNAGSTDAIILESSIEIERYYTFDYATTPTGLSFDTTSNDIEIIWPFMEGAEEYELEWTYINDYDETGYKATTALAFDFKHNSTRIHTTDNSWHISDLFQHGYILYRVRGVGRTGTDYSTRLEGAWSAVESGTINSLSDKIHLEYELEQDSMNWSYQAGYTDNGKQFEGISYMDGLGVGRQSQGKNNTEQKAIVQESYLDYSGRMAVSALPAPTDTNGLHYKEKFNTNYNGDHYSRNDFDKDTSFCGNTTHPMDSTSGAGQYYSGNNPDKNAYQAYVPDAEGYPMIRVEYLSDNTGRIKSQRSAGRLDTTGRGIETQYRYGSTLPTQINPLFGTDVGDDSKYQRNLVEDPNGQISASYIDLSGRVIATSLIGASPTGIDALASNLGASASTATLLAYNTSQTISPDGKSIEYDRTFSVDVDGIHSFTYSLTPEQYEDSCLAASICFDCAYDLHIEISRIDYDSLCFGDSAVVFVLDTAINGIPFNDSCDAASEITIDTNRFNVSLVMGDYAISKVLTVQDTAVEYYAAAFLEHDTCLLDYQDFYNGILANTDFSGCDLTDSDLSCLQELGTRIDYITNHDTLPDPGAYYDSLYRDCINNDDSVYYDPCQGFANALQSDFIPGGQYAQFEMDSLGYFSASDSLSIFYTGNYLPGTISFQSSSLTYYDANGDTALIFNQYQEWVEPTDTSVTMNDFISNFEFSWTETLLPYHPEYCYLAFCDSSQSCHDFDGAMLAEGTFDGAETLDYFNPLDMTMGEGVPVDAWGSSKVDPCFDAGGPMADSLSVMENTLTNYTVVFGDTLTIWEAAYYMTNCPETDSAGLASCLSTIGDIRTDDCINELFWTVYRNLYLHAKREMYHSFQIEYVIENGCYNGCIGNTDFDTLVDGFDCHNIVKLPECSPGSKTYAAYSDTANQTCNYTTSGLYANSIAHFVNLSYNPYAGLTDAQYQDSLLADIDSLLIEQCDTICDDKAEMWLESLVGCASVDSTWQSGYALYDSLKAELVELCVLGCDGSHPGGSLSTPSAADTTHNGNNTIDEVLTEHLGGSYENWECTSLLINEANYYNDSLATTYFDTLDNCGCNELMRLRNSFDSIVLPSNITNIEGLLYLTHSIAVTNINSTLCACDAAWAYNSGNWYDGATWNQQSQDSLETSGVMLPIELTCETCKSCTQIESLNTTLLTIISQVDTTDNYEIILGNYVNHQTGFNLSGEDYADFMEDCDAYHVDSVTCETTQQAGDFINLLTNLIQLDEFLTVSPSYVTIEDNPYYYNTILPQMHNDTAYVQYTSDYGDVDTVLTVSIGNGTDSCTAVLTMPSNSGYNLQWEYLGSLTNIRPNETSCGTAESEAFIITGTFYIAGVEVVVDLTGTSDCYVIADCSCDSLVICNELYHYEYNPNECIDGLYQNVADQAGLAYIGYTLSAIEAFKLAYVEACIEAAPSEQITMNFFENEYHYTLFYYDQAGNLVRTVPPKGVEYVGAFTSGLVDDARAINDTLVPDYCSETEYRYNSFNQILAQASPDGGKSNYWYDYAGRIAVSQNAKQADSIYYSYSKYDEYGRIIEAGQVEQVIADTITETIVKNATSLENWINGGTRYEITRSYYDETLDATIAAKFNNGQNNLRLRIGTVAYYDAYTGSGDNMDYYIATHYSYDRHGNVTEIVQDAPDNAYLNQTAKNIEYEFELISGNVTKVSYELGEVDQYFYKYEYDSDNRLDKVYTSDNGVIYDEDAHYHYYHHGPLARTEIGDWEVQGMDYAYTINGWLKSVNGNILDIDKEMGKDASDHAAYQAGYSAAHNTFAKDAFGFSLGYFDGDYTSIDASNTDFYTSINDISLSGFNDATGNDLFNGNIQHMATALLKTDETEEKQIGSFYKYDQLNRIKSMDAYLGSTYVAATDNGDYNTTYTYDANGSLTSLTRNADGTGRAMDNFTYSYPDSCVNNQLSHVDDAIASGNWAVDIDDQSSGNYTYSQIGELLFDATEDITEIQWRWSDSKVSVIRRTNSKDQIEFKYDAFGNRILKIVKPTNATGTPLTAGTDWTFTSYIRDASGNVISVYDFDLTATEQTLTQSEVNLFGSSRLGLHKVDRLVVTYPYSTQIPVTETPGEPQREMGNKYYELTNHLGNVLSVITDRKLTFEREVNAEITDQVGISVDPVTNVITKTGTTIGWNAGGASSQTFSADGFMEWTIGGTIDDSDYIMVGISYSNTGVSYTTIDYAWYIINTGQIFIFESGVNPVWFGTASVGDVFRINREGNEIVYYMNDVEKRRVTESGSGSMLLDFSMFTPNTIIHNVKLSGVDSLGYTPDVQSYSDYYPFGMLMPNRNGGTENYRYGLNGMEKDNEVSGTGNHYTTPFRQYNPRLGRWMTTDPIVHPWQSPYAAFDNNPIYYSDPSGADGDPPSKLGTEANPTVLGEVTVGGTPGASGTTPDGQSFTNLDFSNLKQSNMYQLAKNSDGAYTLDDLYRWNPGTRDNHRGFKTGQRIYTSPGLTGPSNAGYEDYGNNGDSSNEGGSSSGMNLFEKFINGFMNLGLEEEDMLENQLSEKTKEEAGYEADKGGGFQGSGPRVESETGGSQWYGNDDEKGTHRGFENYNNISNKPKLHQTITHDIEEMVPNNHRIDVYHTKIDTFKTKKTVIYIGGDGDTLNTYNDTIDAVNAGIRLKKVK